MSTNFIIVFENDKYVIVSELNGVMLYKKGSIFTKRLGSLETDETKFDWHKNINDIEIINAKTVLIDNFQEAKLKN